jgi:hypothetical protein
VVLKGKLVAKVSPRICKPPHLVPQQISEEEEMKTLKEMKKKTALGREQF